MSNYQSQEMSISYFHPLVHGGAWAGDLRISLSSWRHTISSFGGFDNAEFELVGTVSEMEDWMFNGLGRSIVASDDGLAIMWEGFVNTITWRQGGLKVMVGPVAGVVNMIKGIYSYIEPNQSPPDIGGRKTTPTYQDLNSQARWGKWFHILGMAGLTDSNAQQLVQMYLSQHKDPQTSSNFSFGDEPISLEIQCLGWFHTLAHPYNQTAVTGEIALGTRMSQLFDSQLNSWISTDHSLISANPTLVKSYQNDDQLAISQIKGYVAMGDEEDNRYTVGIYENRKPVYQPIVPEISYLIDLVDPSQRIMDTFGADIRPWRVRPGKWMFFKDLIPGLGPVKSELSKDIRAMLIEEVRFDIRMPFAVQLLGGTSNSYEQRMARLGLRGMDV